MIAPLLFFKKFCTVCWFCETSPSSTATKNTQYPEYDFAPELVHHQFLCKSYTNSTINPPYYSPKLVTSSILVQIILESKGARDQHALPDITSAAL